MRLGHSGQISPKVGFLPRAGVGISQRSCFLLPAGPATCQGEGDIKPQGEVESCQAIPTHLSLLPDLNVVGIQETLTSEIEALCWGTQVLQVRRRSKVYGLGASQRPGMGNLGPFQQSGASKRRGEIEI